MDSTLLLKPFRWMIKTVESQADVITNLFFPFSSTSRRHNHNRYTSFIPPNCQSQPPPPSSSSTPHTLIKKLTHGLMGAAYSCIILASALILAIIIGVWIVNLWVEDPIIIREKLHLDYTESSPSAVFDLIGGGNKRLPPLIWGEEEEGKLTKTKTSGIPIGHTYTVTIILSMPESDLNLENGVFQLTVEVISHDGVILITRSSKPCMLRYRSRPIRLARTLILCVPVLLGLVQETQKLIVETVRYTEVMKPRSGLIRVMVASRAGEVLRVPQVCEAEIVVKSRLPWRKEIIRDWKWTFYVWSCMWSYLVIVTVLVFCFREVIFGGSGGGGGIDDEVGLGWDDEEEEIEVKGEEEEEVDSRKLRKWQSYRRKRKAELLVGLSSEVDSSVGGGGGGTSYTVGGGGGNGGDYVPPPTASGVDDDSADDENVVEVKVSSSSSSSVRRRRPQPIL